VAEELRLLEQVVEAAHAGVLRLIVGRLGRRGA
jgi:hypothetical protein